MSLKNLFIPITKIDEERRIVYGRATFEGVDSSGEIWDYETSKPYFEAWSGNAAKNSGGRSLGNLRAMHGSIAAGKLTQMVLDDAAKSCDIAAKVVDDGEWAKVLEGVYTGFSQGGRYVKRWKDPDDATKTRYTSAPVEISLVDLPCLPGAEFEYIKADGSVELRKHRTSTEIITMDEPTNEEVAARATDLATKAANGTTWTDHIENARSELVAEKARPAKKAEEDEDETKPKDEDAPAKPKEGDAEDEDEDDKEKKRKTAEKALVQVWQAPDGTTHVRKADGVNHVLGAPPASPIAAALAAARGEEPVAKFEPTPGLAEMPETLRKVWEGCQEHVLLKGMYQVSRLADLIESVAGLQSSCCYEAKSEGDGSAVPQMLGDAVSALGTTLLAMAEEEVSELIAEMNERGANIELAVASFEMAAASEMVKSVAGNELLMAKAGRRNSGGDQALIQAAHDSIVKAGAVCAEDLDKAADLGEDALAKRALTDPVIKALLDERSVLKGQVDEAVIGIAELGESMRAMTETVKKLSAEPTPLAPRTGVVEKSGGDLVVTDPNTMISELMKTAEGRSRLADAAIRASQEQGLTT